MLHLLTKRLISSIRCSDWHLLCSDLLPLDEIVSVDCAQAPRLDELVRELSMEEDSALLDALSDPCLECLLRSQEVYVFLQDQELLVSFSSTKKSVKSDSRDFCHLRQTFRTVLYGTFASRAI